MPRSSRPFRVESFALEGRMLLAASAASTINPTPQVQFVTSMTTGVHIPLQVVTQQAGQATVTLSRPSTVGPLQVEVTTDPTGPIVGVNVGAVDQTITFADGQSLATVTVPILAGAPNPGEVDVHLTARVLDASVPEITGLPGQGLDLMVVASDPNLPPEVVSALVTDQKILVSFNKPMDPTSAANVRNYAVGMVAYKDHGGLFGFFSKTTRVVNPVPLQSAQYDPASQSVVLIPRQHHLDLGFLTGLSQVHSSRTAARPSRSAKAGPGLTDLQGNLINARTNPGKVELRSSPYVVGFDL